MAKKIDINAYNKLDVILRRYFQSGNINFLIGSGASIPAIPAGGDIENELKALSTDPAQELQYQQKQYNFLQGIQKSQNAIIDNDFGNTPLNNFGTSLDSYRKFLTNIVYLLLSRNNTISPKRANIFSTNYDMFIEKASENIAPLHLNDGFERSCRIDVTKFPFSTSTFSQCLHTVGDYYKSDNIPNINLMKLHGSLSWKSDGEQIVFENTILQPIDDTDDLNSLKEYTENFKNIILPTSDKFKDTVLQRMYYDLLRIYSNELDKENTVLFAFGFSFNDEHILEITKRALKNTTLELMIFAYNKESVESFYEKFSTYPNVKIIYTSDVADKIDFEKFNELFSEIKPNEEQND